MRYAQTHIQAEAAKAGQEVTAKRVDKRKTVSTRMTPETRAKLDAASEQSGRSLAQEIELRLERSFLVDDVRAVIREEVRDALGTETVVGTFWPRNDFHPVNADGSF